MATPPASASPVDRLIELLTGPFVRAFEAVTGEALGYTPLAGHARWLVLTLIGGVVWVLTAFAMAPVRPLEPNPQQAVLVYDLTVSFEQAGAQTWFLLETMRKRISAEAPEPTPLTAEQVSPLLVQLPFRVLFGANVARLVLLAGLATWIAFKVAASFMADQHKTDVEVGEHFILQTALANPANVIQVREGNVIQPHQKLPLFLIGGPGRMRVYMENAVLTERIDGEPRVIPPSGTNSRRIEELSGFETIRDPIDLREHKAGYDILARTRDGVYISAKDVQVAFSVFRGDASPTPEQPYPFDPTRLVNFLDGRERGAWVARMRTRIQGQMMDIFAGRFLTEILAMIDTPETTAMRDEQLRILREGQRISGVKTWDRDPTPPNYANVRFLPRPEITEGYYTDVAPRAETDGLALRWIGVGTWDLKEKSIMNRHQDAWKMTLENLNQRIPTALSTIQADAMLAHLLSLVSETPLKVFENLQKRDPALDNEKIIFELALEYIKQYRAALTSMQTRRDDLARRLAGTLSASDRTGILNQIADLDGRITTTREVIAFLEGRFRRGLAMPGVPPPPAGTPPPATPGPAGPAPGAPPPAGPKTGP